MTCYSCDAAADPVAPRRERIASLGVWRVAHAFDSSLPGWLVLVPRPHVQSLEELSEDDAADFGRLVHQASRALARVTGCTKSYVMFFAEAEGFSHLHVHVVPRMPGLTPEQRGPRVFSFLGRPAGERLSEQEQAAMAERLQIAWQEGDQPAAGARNPPD